jgi:predicted enzyme related to lactoylglutathione lyase
MAEDWVRPVVHWEIQAKDAGKMSDFYSKMFNWQIGEEGRVRQISPGIGAPETITGHILESPTSGFSLYVQVLDIHTALLKARDLGGEVLREAFQPAGQPTLAWIADPEGNKLVLVQQ